MKLFPRIFFLLKSFFAFLLSCQKLSFEISKFKLTNLSSIPWESKIPPDIF